MTINFLSTRGGITPVKFDEAILQGFAPDGGLFVPNSIPKISKKQFEDWSKLKFTDLAFELLSLFIERSVIPAQDLKKIINDSFSSFADPEVVKIVLGKSPRAHHCPAAGSSGRLEMVVLLGGMQLCPALRKSVADRYVLLTAAV